MTVQTFTLNTPRSFPEGNFLTQVLEEKHPNRILADHDFFYVLSGAYDIYLDDIKYSLKADDILLMHAGIRHYGLSHCAPNTQLIWLHVKPVLGDGFYRTVPDFSVSNDIVMLPSMVSCHNNPEVKKMLSEIVFSLNAQESHCQARMNAFFTLCLLEINKCAQEQIHLKSELVYSVIRLFQNNPSKHFTMKELSEQFYTNGKTINRHFLSLYGKTAHSYQIDMKLASVAKYITLNPDATLRAIALNNGFYDEFHLSKSFKKKYGLSPDAYRKQHYMQYKDQII